jgi:futalosine hydrolase
MTYPEMRKKKAVGIIVAVEAEGDLVAGRLKPASRRPTGPVEFRTGAINDTPVVYSVSGLGKTNAAHCATSLILNFAPSIVIHFGVGGAYPASGLMPGDIAVATKEVYADEGVLLGDGFHPLEFIGIPLVKTAGRKYYNEFPLDASPRRVMLRAAKAAGLRAAEGVFTTVSTCTGTRKRAAELAGRYGAICENMEGAAVAHICRMYKMPCVEVRGISNIVEGRDLSKWDIPLASRNCQKAVTGFLDPANLTLLY